MASDTRNCDGCRLRQALAKRPVRKYRIFWTFYALGVIELAEIELEFLGAATRWRTDGVAWLNESFLPAHRVTNPERLISESAILSESAMLSEVAILF